MEDWLLEALQQGGLLQAQGVHPPMLPTGLLPPARSPALLPQAPPIVGMRDPTTGEPLTPTPMQQVEARERAQMAGAPPGTAIPPVLAPPPSRTRPGFFRRFLTGAQAGDPLNPEEQKDADKTALLLAGLQMFAASQGGPGQPRPSLASVILAGRQAGQQTYGQMVERAQGRRSREALSAAAQSLTSGGTPVQQLQKLPQMTMQALAAGDFATAAQLAELAKTFGVDLGSLVERAQNGELQFIKDEDSGQIAVYDKNSGQLLRTDSPFGPADAPPGLGANQRASQTLGFISAFNQQTQKLQATAQAAMAVQDSLAEAREKIAASGNAGPAGVSLVYALAQFYDPGSVVREGDTLMVQRGANLTSQILSMISRVNAGTFDTGMLKDIEGIVQRRTASARNTFERQRRQYIEMGNSLGVGGLDRVLINPFEAFTPAAPTPPPPATPPMTPGQADAFEQRHQ